MAIQLSYLQPREKRKYGLIQLTVPKRAKYGLIKLIGGKKIHIEEHGTDIHDRTLGTIYVQLKNRNEWQNVNERMVTLGHAWVMRMYYGHLSKERQNKLNQLERWAKSKQVGLWKSSNPISPWKWRRS